jgi:L,D-transpeptidase catalytic domain
VPGHPTPLGVFSIIEKDRYHHSNIYSGAPMPYMQRITWSGVALHEGVLPGYPASHGCIRMSHDFAMKLWPITKLGVRVIVTRHDVAPIEFEHAKLFSPKAKPPEQKVAGDVTTGANVQFAQATSETTSDAPAPAMKTEQPSMAEPAPMPESVDAPKAAEVAPAAKDSPATEETATGAIAPPAAPAAAETVPAPAPDLRKAVEAPSAPAEAAPATPAAAETPAIEDLAKPAPTVDPAKPVVPRTKAADQPTKRTGQVAVFVSRKEKKIFVRQGMVPLFDMPIAINDPDQPLGTHVFTALSMTQDGAMHWNLMSVPNDPVATAEDHYGRRRSREAPRPVVSVSAKPASTAAEALDRIQFPKEAVDRISEILTPGSSLVISDAGLGPETGRGTEFIVLTR